MPSPCESLVVPRGPIPNVCLRWGILAAKRVRDVIWTVWCRQCSPWPKNSAPAAKALPPICRCGGSGLLCALVFGKIPLHSTHSISLGTTPSECRANRMLDSLRGRTVHAALQYVLVDGVGFGCRCAYRSVEAVKSDACRSDEHGFNMDCMLHDNSSARFLRDALRHIECRTEGNHRLPGTLGIEGFLGIRSDGATLTADRCRRRRPDHRVVV